MKKLVPLILLVLGIVFVYGCATTYHDPDTGEQIENPIPVDTDEDGDVDHFESPDRPGVPLEERTEVDADAAAGAGAAVAPFLGPAGVFVMPALSLLTLILNRKED
jgi:hypothetical protein